jgi:predicted amidohydrolase YtcJ
VKFYGDGGTGSRSAWLSEPYEGEPNNFGIPVEGDYAKREAQYRAALDYGWDLHTHCCGDRAMRETVDLYMKLMDELHAKRPEADLRWSVIHAYLPLEPKTRVLEDMARYHIIACINPVFNWQEGLAHTANLGEERMARFQPARSYIKAGVKLVCGSDYTVTAHDPWISIYELLTRREQVTGKIHGADETIDIADALRTYTINGAFLTYDENFRGNLEVGKAADLVVLDLSDIRELDRHPELCLAMRQRILLTMVDGQVRYQKPGGSL